MESLASLSIEEKGERGTMFLIGTCEHFLGQKRQHDFILFLVNQIHIDTDNEVLAHIPSGEHGRGVYAWHLNGQGVLSKVCVNEITPNPAFILKHPTLDIVYLSTECIHTENCGEVITCSLGCNGLLTEINRTQAGGRSTCYLNIHRSQSFLTAVNYWDSIVSLLPINKDGTVNALTDQHMQPEAAYVFINNPNRVEHWTHRQRWPHTHCFVTDPFNYNVHFVCDLGKDIMWAYRVNESNRKLTLCGGTQLELKQGPRHLVFHPDHRTCFVVNELNSTVSVFQYNSSNINDGIDQGEVIVFNLNDPSAFLKHVQTLKTLPSDFDSNDHHRNHAAEIRLHSSGKFLLVANRGHDSIACFKIDHSIEGIPSLALLHITPSGGKCPRNFSFDSSGQWVVVGNQNSNNLTVFSFDAENGVMEFRDQKYQPSPNFVYSLPSTPQQTQTVMCDPERGEC